MSLFQAFLIAIIGWLAHHHTPFSGGSMLNTFTFGRPLVAGAVIGLILGNVREGIILSAGVQALYIGAVSPGGSITPDMNLAVWVAIPLGLVSGATPGIVVAMAAPLALLGTILIQPCNTAMLIPIQHQRKLVEQGKLQQATLVPIYGHTIKFLFRFTPVFLCLYLGQDFLNFIMNNSPIWLTDVLTVFGNPMPLLGFGILLKMMIKDNLEFIYYVFGFALIAVLNLSIITVVIFACVFAYVELKSSTYAKGKGK